MEEKTSLKNRIERFMGFALDDEDNVPIAPQDKPDEKPQAKPVAEPVQESKENAPSSPRVDRVPRMTREKVERPERPERPERAEKPEPKRWQSSGQTSRGKGGRGKTIVNMQAQVRMEVAIESPESFEEASEVCTRLKNKQPVVVDLESLELSHAQKIAYFLCGASCALNGKIRQISDKIFLVTPENVDLDADENFLHTLESDGNISFDD